MRKRYALMVVVASVPLFFDSAWAVEYTGEKYRDPFGGSEIQESPQEVQGAEIQILSLTLDGIIWMPKHPQAIVSGNLVTVGSMIGQAQVVSIDKDTVKVQYKKKDFVLSKKG